MNSKILVLMSLASVLLLAGCKSEGDKVVEKACDLDLSVSENQGICEKALSSNCGDFYREADAAQRELLGLKHWKMLFQFNKKGDLDDDEKARVKEADAELKEKERAIKERWNKLPLTSTCKDALEELYKVQWEAERKMMEKDLAERTKDRSDEKSEGFFSTIIGKIKGIFASKKADEINEKVAESKLSELSPAIGTYIKLQNEYVGEGKGELGTWNQIGYSAPPDRDDFYYKEYRQGDVKGLLVTSRKNLADCPANSSWMVRCLYVNKESICDFSIESKNQKACESISQGFKRMGEKTSEPFIKTTYDSFNEKLRIAEKQSEIHSENVERSAETVQKKEQDNLTVAKDEITDARDGKIYKIAEFDGKLWMTENLNFTIENSYCYDNDEGNCEKYGRLYTWSAAKKACPKGWRLPKDYEWDNVLFEMNLFAGYYYVAKDGFYNKDKGAFFWSGTENDAKTAFDYDINVDSKTFVKKNHSKSDVAFSVRCIKN